MKEIDKDKLQWTIFCVVIGVAMCAPLVYVLLAIAGIYPPIK